jgi:plastocyanin
MRRVAVVAGALVFLVAMTLAAGAARPRVVEIVGDEEFVPNQLIESDFRFDPGMIRVRPGGEVRWRNTTDDEHTVTIVAAEDVPQDFDEVFECRDPGGVCRAALDAHFSSDPPVRVLNAGAPGLDAPGDSLLIEDESVSAIVSAPAGSVLSYVCAVQPVHAGDDRRRIGPQLLRQ